MKNVLLLIVGSGFLAASLQISAQELLATTNQGELVEIDLAGGTATLIGDAGIFNGKDIGWTGLSFDAAGDLFAVSRINSEPSTGCAVSPVTTNCAHLYRVDSINGAILEEIGNAQAPHISDIDFASGGTAYGNQWDGQGTLITINPASAIANIVGHFGSPLQNGGLSVHPITGEIWAVESTFGLGAGISIFTVDTTTGAAIPPIVQLGLLGTPPSFGFDALEILPNGRFIATRARRSSEVYEIDPIPDATSGLAEITLIPLVLDAGITGSLTGLESLTSTIVDDDDEDGVQNGDDNCPDIANADQSDVDLDGVGDVCDNDDDNDGILDDDDNCPLDMNVEQTDSDNDGLGDACDDDDDNDTVLDGDDNCPLIPNTGQSDFDDDGVGDACDEDVDGDDVRNEDDPCLATPVGDLVNPNTGCSIEQLCPCDGPQGTTVPWRNHGKYVSCTAHAANEFVEQGLITQAQKGEIMTLAGQSSCGKKK
jgi:hypothetical protein